MLVAPLREFSSADRPSPAPARRLALALVGMAFLLAAAAAQAALGGDVASALRDHERLRTTHTVVPTALYDLHEGVSSNGTQLREYVDRGGKVFAVSWQGPRSPDVANLLGASAARYQGVAKARHGSHHVVTIDDADLAVTVMRLPRGWQGEAVLPRAVPAGVARADLR
jgi:hypothetical protein